jgi:hypothetical protein
MYRLNGHRVRCGKCLPLMTELLAAHAPESTPGDERSAAQVERAS